MRSDSCISGRNWRANRPARRPPRRGWHARSRPSDRSSWSPAATSPPKRPLLSWPGDEGRDPPRLRPCNRALQLRKHVHDAFDAARVARGDLLELPPVLHRQAEARRHGRPCGTVPAAAREGRARRALVLVTAMSQAVGGQAVLEGVMMRGPRNWAVAVRKPDGEIAHVSKGIAPLAARHWTLRLPIVRRVGALRHRL